MACIDAGEQPLSLTLAFFFGYDWTGRDCLFFLVCKSTRLDTHSAHLYERFDTIHSSMIMVFEETFNRPLQACAQQFRTVVPGCCARTPIYSEIEGRRRDRTEAVKMKMFGEASLGLDGSRRLSHVPPFLVEPRLHLPLS
jgi:hypothetical protein